MALRCIDWTFHSKPLKREASRGRTKASPPGEETSSSWGPKKIATDAVDLMMNLRGIGWDWSTGHFPPFTRSTESTTIFLLGSFASSAAQFVATDILQYIIQWISPSTFATFEGGTIFDPSLPPLLRYSRSSLITLLGGMAIYLNLCADYDLFACIGIAVFRQHPTQWPPLFHRPWKSRSLCELWGKRWHQLFRRVFTALGSRSLSHFGRFGQVMGAFLLSALMHDIQLWTMGRGTDFWYTGGFFLMMGVGVCLEGIWKMTGRKVGGFAGWVWTMAWTIGWANLFIDAWYRRGVAGCNFFAENQRPTDLLQYVYP
jgi:Membrane bound O-acyl transferase family